jgi:uncharacterized membrane protein YccC
MEFAVRAAVAATIAIWVGDRIGLQDSYWAGISAVIASAGTLGASVENAISRISATLVGLIVGLAAVALPVQGTLVSGLTVFASLVVFAALSLDAGARLGAATTLIMTAIPGSNPVADALARGANIPLGCVVAVAVGLVLWPHRAARQLRDGLEADIRQAGELARAALLAYVGIGADDGLPGALQRLTRRPTAHRAALREAGRELGGEGLSALRRDVAAVDQLIAHVAALVRACLEGSEQQQLLPARGELKQAADALAGFARAIAEHSESSRLDRLRVQLTEACSALDAALGQARATRATADLSSAEVGRFMAIMRDVQHVTSALFALDHAIDDP